MNIFVLHENPSKAAMLLHDRHVLKMIVESAQILSTAHHHYQSAYVDEVYRKTHFNHPCCVWVRESASNYVWLAQHLMSLFYEYHVRFGGKHHKTMDIFLALAQVPVPVDKGLTPFAQAMPEQYRDEDAVKAYRRYYVAEKLVDKNGKPNTWKIPEQAAWVNEELNGVVIL